MNDEVISFQKRLFLVDVLFDVTLICRNLSSILIAFSSVWFRAIKNQKNKKIDVSDA